MWRFDSAVAHKRKVFFDLLVKGYGSETTFDENYTFADIFDSRQNLDTALSVWASSIFMLGFSSTASSVKYYRTLRSVNNAYDKAEANARRLFGNENWDKIQNTILRLEGEPLVNAIYAGVCQNKSLSDEQKKAFLNYVRAQKAQAVFNNAVSEKYSFSLTGEELNEMNAMTIHAYAEGRNMQTPQEYAQAQQAFADTREMAMSALGVTDDIDAYLDTLGETPAEQLKKGVEAAKEKGLDEKAANAALSAYLNAREQQKGAMDGITSDESIRRQHADSVIRQITFENEADSEGGSGKVILVNVKGREESVFLIRGRYENGSITGETVVVSEGNGVIEMIPASEVEGIVEESDAMTERQREYDKIDAENKEQQRLINLNMDTPLAGQGGILMDEEGHRRQVGIKCVFNDEQGNPASVLVVDQNNNDYLIPIDVFREQRGRGRKFEAIEPYLYETDEEYHAAEGPMNEEYNLANKEQEGVSEEDAQGAAEGVTPQPATDATEKPTKPEVKYDYHVKMKDGSGNAVSGRVTNLSADGVEIEFDAPYNGKMVDRIPLADFDNGVSEIADANGNVLWNETEAVGDTEVVPQVDATPTQVGQEDAEKSAIAQAEQEHKPTALERIPVNDAGERMFEQADKETALDALDEMTGHNSTNTAAIVKAQYKQAQADLDKLKKKAPTRKEPVLRGTPMEMIKAQQEADANYNTAMTQYNAQVAEAEAKLDAWTKIYALMNERERVAREQAEAEQRERDKKLHDEAVAKLEEQKRIAAEKSAEQEAVGTHAVNPKIKKKWNDAVKIEGNANAITLADGSTIRGRYVLTESGAATASHDVNNAYEPTEGFPIDENGESVNDRDYKRDKDAQRIVREMADNYDSRALQTPIIVSKDGVVLSGNNRTMSGELAAQQGTDKAYIDYLREFGKMFGFTSEQIEGMKHPRVVFVLDEALPYDAKTFARFNAEQQKRQSKPEHAVKLGKIVPDSIFASITNDISRFDRMSDFYADEKSVDSAISKLLEAGVINEMQLPELRTGNSLSASGKELIENALIGKVFQSSPDAVRQIIGNPTLRQSIIMGLNEIANNRTLAKSGYDLSQELGAAVDLVARAKTLHPDIYKEGVPVSPFGREQGLFDDEYGDSRVTDGIVLLLADLLNSGKPSELRKVLASYNNEAADFAAGQIDMFSGEVTSKEKLLNNVLNHFRNATPKEQQAIVDAAIAERKRRAEASKQVGDTSGRSGEAEDAGLPKGRKQVVNRLKMLNEASSPKDKLGLIYRIMLNVKNGEEGTITPEEQAYVDKVLAELKEQGYEMNNDGIIGREDIDVNDTVVNDVQLAEPVDPWYEKLEDGQTVIYRIIKPRILKDGKLYQAATVGAIVRSDTSVSSELYEAKKKLARLLRADNNNEIIQHQIAEIKAEIAELEKKKAEELASKASDKQLAANIEAASAEVDTNAGEESEEIKPIGKGVFGNIYDQFKGKVKAAFDFLIKHKSGDLLGVFHREGFGDIDLVWGDDKKGLQHIINDHILVKDPDFQNIEEAVSRINDIIMSGVIVKEGEAKIVFEKDGYRVVISKNIHGEKKNWILTSYDSTNGKGKIKERLSDNTTTITPGANKGSRAVASSENLSTDKVTESSPSPQENGPKNSTQSAVESASAEVETSPSEAQKKAGNYKMGHVKVGAFDVTIENPKGSERSGTDANGKKWSVKMNNTYGYIRGTEGVDGDHIDVFLAEDMDKWDGKYVFVVDQYNPDGTFDEHKVMLGFNSTEEARSAYLSNYEKGWENGRRIDVARIKTDGFQKWVDSSHRKTKPFAHYVIAGAADVAEGKPKNESDRAIPPSTSGKVRMQKTQDYSEFAEKYGVNADDVRAYAEGMALGNVVMANQAFTEIRRTKRIEHRGMKLSEFAKAFNPIKEELYEKFGNVDELNQEYVRRAEEERNMMEAARKKAEEEERKRQAHLDELSLLDDAAIDERYMEALQRGDEATAREMLDEAARRKGYGDTASDYQGVGAWVAPANPGYENDAERRADVEDNAPDVNIEDIALGYSLVDEKYWQEPRKYMQTDATAIESVNAIREAIAAVRRGEKNVKVKVYRAVPTSVKEGKLRNGDWVTPSKDYAKMHGEHRLEGKYRIIEDEVSVNDLWWDGNDSREWGFDNGKGYKYKNVKNNRKSDDLVTRDDKGNVIPPSKRFNHRKADERYQKAGTPLTPNSAEVALRDAIADLMRKSGLDVIDHEVGQQVLDEANRDELRMSLNDNREYEGKTSKERSDIQYKKAKELLSALHEAGFKGFEISRSITPFGVSTYIQGDLGLKFRISDHGVSSFGRIFGEEHISLNTSSEYVVQLAKDRKKDINAQAEKYKKERAIKEEREKRANEKWNRIKANFEGMVFKRNDRTYQDYDTFSNSISINRQNGHKYQRRYVMQTAIGKSGADTAYRYEWAEPADIDEYGVATNIGSDRPSLEFIEAYDEADTAPIIREQRLSNTGLYNPRKYISPVRGQWTKDKILRRLKDIGGSRKGLITAAKIISEFDSPEELEAHMYYHGTQYGGGALKPSILMSDRDIERYGGGGYGVKYWGISVSKSKKVASNFSQGEGVSIYPIILCKSAKVVEVNGVEDAEDLDEYIEQLWKDGVDAVWIGKGEQELCVLNPNAIVNIDRADYYRSYKLGSEENPLKIIDKEGIAKLYHDAKAFIQAYKKSPKKPLMPSPFEESNNGELEYKPKDKYEAEMREYERKNDEYLNSDEYREWEKAREYAKENIRFFRTSNGEAYGFTVGGKIYIDPRIATAETPIHEYAHLWATAMREGNPTEWKNIVGLMKGTSVWAEVQKLYPELKNDDDIADEVLATFSGLRGAERLRAEQQKIMQGDGSVFEKAAAVGALARVKQALSKFWKGVADFLGIHYTSAEEVADRVMKDLLEGVDPRKFGVSSNDDIRLSTSEELSQRYGSRWIEEQTNEDGRHTTQVKNTINSYKKFGDFVKRDSNGKNVSILDASSGLGLGTEWMRENGMNVDDVEPYPSENRIAPTYTSYNDIHKKYDYIISNAVLNVIPDDWRANVLHDMTDKLKKGGKLVINVRSAESIRKQGKEGITRITQDDASEILVLRPNGSIKAYQKGFTKDELKKWCETELGSDYSVEIANEKNAGGSYDTAVVVTKNSESDNILYRQGEDTPHVSTSSESKSQAAQKATENLNLDGRVVVHESAEGLEGKEATAKGWYDTQTGQIHVVLSNNADAADVTQTILHEAVAHHGLRELFGHNVMDAFLDSVLAAASQEVKNAINELRRGNGWNFRTATEEYLAGLAERTDFERMTAEERGLFATLRRLFNRALEFLGLKNHELSDRELAYILWCSYQNLKTGEKGRYVAEAERIAMRYKLKAGKNAMTDTEKKEHSVLLRGKLDNLQEILAKDTYERLVTSGSHLERTAWVDMLSPLQDLQHAIEKNGGFKLGDFENPYNAYITMSSRNYAQMDIYKRTLYADMIEAIHALGSETGRSYEEIKTYVMAKHGMERQKYMAGKAAEEAYDRYKSMHPFGQKTLDDFIDEYEEKSFAGLTELFGTQSVSDAMDEAQKYVEEVEAEAGSLTDSMWDSIRAATKSSLQRAYEAGLISKETYDNVSSMYQYYIPLRGFDEATSDEVYEYFGDQTINGGTGSFMKKAKGRKSVADDPFAVIGNMAEMAIMQSNRNLMKQQLLNLALNHPSDLISVSDLYVKFDEDYDNGDGTRGAWVPVAVPDTSGMTTEEANQVMLDFQDDMEEKVKDEPDTYALAHQKTHIPYRVLGRNMNEHQVMVKRGGKTYILTINANPRAAQAINGLLNPDATENPGAIALKAMTNWIARMATARNVEFAISNAMRDLEFSTTLIPKEGTEYYGRYVKNYLTCVKNIGRLVNRLNGNTLDMSNPLEKTFYDFIYNGGETGYTFMRGVERYKGEITKALSELRAKEGKSKIERLGNKVVYGHHYIINDAWNIYMKGAEYLSRCTEDWVRFAVFLTSRQMGRSMEQSIMDAKEVTVNFNRKGAGSKSAGKWDVSNFFSMNNLHFLSAYAASAFKNFYAFSNASIQGLDKNVRLHLNHTAGMLMWDGAAVTLGMLSAMCIPLMLSAIGGDPDDYWDMPESMRRMGIMLPLGKDGRFLTLPMSIEHRAAYGIGELLGTVVCGSENLPASEITFQAFEQLSQILPLDLTEGNGSMLSLVPTAVRPEVEIAFNKNWLGMPIYKEPFNKNTPAFRNVYQSTNPNYIAMSKWLNEVQGGGDYERAGVQVNPAMVQHLVESYTGGAGKFVSRTSGVIAKIIQGEQIRSNEIPFYRTLVRSVDDRTHNRAARERFQREYDKGQKLIYKIDNYQKESARGNSQYVKELDEFAKSKDFMSYMLWKSYNSVKSQFDNARSYIGDDKDKRAALDHAQMLVQKMMTECARAVENSKTQEEADEKIGRIQSEYTPQIKETLSKVED